jgi:NH3-dependent NAD+ synthetase
LNKKISHTIDEIIDQYTIEDSNRPWVIGFSGGKDSTVMLTLVWLSLLKIKNEIDEKFLKSDTNADSGFFNMNFLSSLYLENSSLRNCRGSIAALIYATG